MMLDTLKTVLKVYGPTGQETQVAECLKKLLDGHVDSMRVDAMGSLIVEKKGREGGKTLMFSAHMDHIGLVVTDIEDTGYLRVTNVGGVSVDCLGDGEHINVAVFKYGDKAYALTMACGSEGVGLTADELSDLVKAMLPASASDKYAEPADIYADPIDIYADPVPQPQFERNYDIDELEEINRMDYF